MQMIVIKYTFTNVEVVYKHTISSISPTKMGGRNKIKTFL